MAMINNLKDFERFLKICRRKSVDKVTIDGLSVDFLYMPNQREREDDDDESVPQEGISAEELAFYHISGEK